MDTKFEFARSTTEETVAGVLRDLQGWTVLVHRESDEPVEGEIHAVDTLDCTVTINTNSREPVTIAVSDITYVVFL